MFRARAAIFIIAVLIFANYAYALKVYHVGNSFTLQSEQRFVIQCLARAAGHEHTYSMSCILGAPLEWIWNHEGDSGGWEGQPYNNGLAPGNSWDVLILQTYDRPVDNDILYAGKFFDLALKGNPNCQLYIFNIWPDQSEWNNPREIRTIGHAEAVADGVTKAHPQSRPVLVIPAGKVVLELAKLADAGQLPGVANHAGLYSDNGHLNNYGSYAVACTHCAVLYHEDPANYITTIPGKWNSTPIYEIKKETADVIKRVVWQVVTSYPRDGVKAGLGISTRSLPDAVINAPYSAALKAENAKGAVTWSLAGGQLPPGISLDGKAGLIHGAAKKAGAFSFTVGARDAGAAQPSTVELKIVVQEDKAPTLPAPEHTATVALGSVISQKLTCDGGNGILTWSLSGGALPTGVSITPTGLLTGSPGEQGTFKFTVKVSDSFPAGPRSATREMTLIVGPPEIGTLLVARTLQPFQIDWDLAIPIEKTVKGNPAATGRFAVQWDAGNLYVSIKVTNAKVGDADAVEIFIDALHDRQTIYNQGDRQIIITRTGKVTANGGHNQGIKAAAHAADGGYIIDATIPWSNLQLKGGEKLTLGFDVAMDEADKQGNRANQKVWFGAADNDKEATHFGNLVLTAGSVGAVEP